MNYAGHKTFRNNIEKSTLMVKLDLFALNTQKIKIGVILVLCHTEYFPLFKVEHKFSMTLILLKRGIQISNCIKTEKSQMILLFQFFFIYLLICSGLDSAFVDGHSEREEAEVVGGRVS